MTDETVEIRNSPEIDAYVIEIDGEVVGRADYRLRDNLYKFFHTEVDPGRGGEGLGTRLVRYALDDVRAKGGSVVPICPFFASFIASNPDYEDLVDVDVTERLNRATKE